MQLPGDRPARTHAIGDVTDRRSFLIVEPHSGDQLHPWGLLSSCPDYLSEHLNSDGVPRDDVHPLARQQLRSLLTLALLQQHQRPDQETQVTILSMPRSRTSRNQLTAAST